MTTPPDLLLGGLASSSGRLHAPAISDTWRIPDRVVIETADEARRFLDGARGEIDRLEAILRTSSDAAVTVIATKQLADWQAAIASEQTPEDWLVPSAEWGAGRHATATEGSLEEFLRLRNAPTTAIGEYAAKFGLLGLEAYEPAVSSVFVSGAGDWPAAPGAPYRRKPLTIRETVRVWRSLGEHLQALLNIAARLHRGKAAEPADLDALATLAQLPATTDSRNRRASVHRPPPSAWVIGESTSEIGQRQLLTAGLSGLLGLGSFRPRFAWEPQAETPEIRFAPAGLYEALVHRLTLAVAGVSDIETCSACGVAYVPRRAVVQSKRHYCGNCRRRAAWRDAARDYRRRRREAETGLSGL
jgi:hypothetical protein